MGRGWGRDYVQKVYHVYVVYFLVFCWTGREKKWEKYTTYRW